MLDFTYRSASHMRRSIWTSYICALEAETHLTCYRQTTMEEDVKKNVRGIRIEKFIKIRKPAMGHRKM